MERFFTSLVLYPYLTFSRFRIQGAMPAFGAYRLFIWRLHKDTANWIRNLEGARDTLQVVLGELQLAKGMIKMGDTLSGEKPLMELKKVVNFDNLKFDSGYVSVETVLRKLTMFSPDMLPQIVMVIEYIKSANINARTMLMPKDIEDFTEIFTLAFNIYRLKPVDWITTESQY